MTPLALVVCAIEALEDGDVEFAHTTLQELETRLLADQNRWVTLDDVPLIPDMSVFEEPETA